MTKEERARGLYEATKIEYGKEHADDMILSIAINVAKYMNLGYTEANEIYDFLSSLK